MWHSQLLLVMCIYDRIKKYILDRRYSLIFLAIAVICLFALLSMLRLYLLPGWRRIGYSMVDAIFIVTPYFFLKGRWRWTLLVCTTMLSVIVVIAIYYARVFHELIQVKMFVLTENFGGLLLDSWVGLVELSDVVYLALLVLPYIVYFAFREKVKSEPSFSIKIRICALSTTILLFIASQVYANYGIYKWYKLHTDNVDIVDFLQTSYVVNFDTGNTKQLYQLNGFLVHVACDIYNELTTPGYSIELNDIEKQEIEVYLESQVSEFQANDSLNVNNSSKNVIFVIAESLNAEVIGLKVNGNEVAPTLNRLIADSSTFYCTNVIPQIKLGNSGDGQFIYNTGLLPLNNVIVSSRVGDSNVYPSLFKSLGRIDNRTILPDNGVIWAQMKMQKAFGADSIYITEDYLSFTYQFGLDACIFRFASSKLDELKQPFTLQIVTGSMHIPFLDGEEYRHMFESSSHDNNVRNYYASTYYFDKELARFIDDLKSRGLWENCILIIASDHDQNISLADKSTAKEHSNPIVFIVANSGRGGVVNHSVGQVDVFPTLLHLCGHSPDIDYVGVGHSMLSGISGVYDVWSKNVVDCNDSIHETKLLNSAGFSEQIIRGNYFGHANKN